MTGLRMLLTNHRDEGERIIQRIDMTGVTDEFRLLFDERVMRRPIGGIKYGLHAFNLPDSADLTIRRRR